MPTRQTLALNDVSQACRRFGNTVYCGCRAARPLFEYFELFYPTNRFVFPTERIHSLTVDRWKHVLKSQENKHGGIPEWIRTTCSY